MQGEDPGARFVAYLFRCVSLFRDPESASRFEENDERALSICLSIRQVEPWDLEPARVIALERQRGPGRIVGRSRG